MMNFYPKFARRIGALFLIGMVSLVMPGCAPDFTDNQALTQLRFYGVQRADGGAFSTARGVVSRVHIPIEDEVTLLITNEGVAPNPLLDEGINNSMYDVLLEGYTVSFERTDGGTNVPASWGVVYTELIPATQFGSVATRPIAVSLYPIEQKYVRPLSDLLHFGYEQGTNFSEIQAEATVHLFGRNRIGDKLDVTCKFHVTFCNYCDEE